MGKRRKCRGAPRGSAVRASSHAGPQVVDIWAARWTDAHEARFLDELGATCNVTRAARVVGFSTQLVYRKKRNDAGFAERWRQALAQGYDRIELALLRRAEEALEGRVPDRRNPIAPMTVKEALSLLKMHQASVHGEGVARGGRARPRSLDEVRHSIIIKLEAIEAARLAGEGGASGGEASGNGASRGGPTAAGEGGRAAGGEGASGRDGDDA